ncbi:MAG TPA: FAD:protein FMN transferase, partial [Candidatus Hydrogenedentes bacterium]|nr:FAD:protein FMN transferase [Candidatus Hydrogenedentota bacterium]
VVHLEHGALATSGNYRNMYEVDGKLYSHTIDPRTGYPVQHRLASASVIHPSCALADGYATALMALGPEKALELAEKLNMAAMLIVAGEDAESFETITTAKFERYLGKDSP